MTGKKPGAIVNVRMGQYADVCGFLHHGFIHDHVCAVPGCGLLLDCHGAPMPLEYNAGEGWSSWSGRWSCQLKGPDPLCINHEGAVPCDYCGEYGHDEAHCPEAASTETDCAWSKADHEEHEADAAHAREKDGR